MSRVVLLLFLGVCVMSAHMAPAGDGDTAPETQESPEKRDGDTAPETQESPEKRDGDTAPETQESPEKRDEDKAPETPESREKQGERMREIVNASGSEIEAEVRKTDPSFNWDSWWSEAVPILKIIGKIAPANKQNKKQLCSEGKEAEEKYTALYGPKIEEEVRKTVNNNFEYESWRREAKKIMKVVGEVVNPLAEKAKDYCKEEAEVQPGA